MKTILASTILILSVSLAACGKKKSAATDNSSTGTTFALAGNYIKCGVFGAGAGTTLNGKGFVRTLSLNADHTYTYGIFFSDNVGCAASFASGGNNTATYAQSGTWEDEGSAVGGETKLKLNVGAAVMTIRPVYSDGADIRDHVNANCTPAPAFAGGATADTKSFVGLTCSGSAAVDIPSPPSGASSYYNIFTLSGSTLTAGARDDLFVPGASSYPGATSESWEKY